MPGKRSHDKDEVEHDNPIEVEMFGERFLIEKSRIRVEDFYNPPIA